MRLERLEIGGFGRLQQVDIDFGARVTVLLGDNESGKSTVHRAVRAALFGIDAGGQGRPTERSDWARWTPWAAGGYSLVLTYELRDGRRVRVARRLEQREQVCQVQEIGGGDLTDSMRLGRVVAPGAVHLGIDEAVFCASACVGDDALRLGAGDAPAARATEVQEAIERLADSGEQTTAAQALAALREAMTRVGSERRRSSPLGNAVDRLRQLDVQVADVRRTLGALAADEERLRALEADAHSAQLRRVDAERRWLVGRLAGISAQRADAEAAGAELAAAAAEAEATAHLASFPLDAEDTVPSLAAQTQEAERAAAQARDRAAAAAPQLANVRRRRAEIGAGLRALARSPELGAGARDDADGLRRELGETLAGRRRAADLGAATLRRDALRREIARTGVAGPTAAGVEAALELLPVARGRRASRVARLAASALFAVCVMATAVLTAAHVRDGALLAGGAAAVAATALVLDRLLGGEAAMARRRLAALCPGVPLDGDGLAKLAERLPRLRALHAELQREEVRVDTIATEVDAVDAHLADLARRALATASGHGLDVSAIRASAGGGEATVRAALDALAGAAGIAQRRDELHTEDALLEAREAELAQVADDARQLDEAALSVRRTLQRVLAGTGVDPSLDLTDSVAAFRAACAGRRRHDAARERVAELHRRRSRTPDLSTLERLRADLERRLLSRDGDPAEAAAAPALDQAHLAELEHEVEHATQAAHSSSRAADDLGAALAGRRGAIPSLADLEDEREACLAARDRGRRQLVALQRAVDLVEASTRTVHRDLAPRLARSVGERLSMLTEGRYSAVNVDTAHFAVSLAGRDRPDLVPLEVLSHGTRDQVALLLRVALAEVLSAGGEPIPVLLDEPLLSADPQRRATAMRFLWQLSEANQVVMSTSDPSIVTELQEACDGVRPAVIDLPAPGTDRFRSSAAIARAL